MLELPSAEWISDNWVFDLEDAELISTMQKDKDPGF